MAHELGHALGLPDYYHWIDRSAGARGRRWVLGCWDLMAAGSWGCGRIEEPRLTFGPTHLSAHSKHRLGWIDYVQLGEVWNEEIYLDPVQTSGRGLRIALDGTGDEYLLAEYRARVGFDEALPAAGVLFYKQDLGASLFPDPAGAAPYFLTVLEQDDDDGLLRTDPQGGDRGAAGDVWGVGSVGELHALSRPPLLTSAGAATPVTVHEVSVVGGRARLVVPTPKLVAPAGSPALPASVRVAGGVPPYVASWYGPNGVSVVVVGDEILVTGPPASATTLELALSVQDAAGAGSETLLASPGGYTGWAPELTELLAPLLGLEENPLGAAQRGFLDRIGNRNGSYDVGDVRRWLREHPSG